MTFGILPRPSARPVRSGPCSEPAFGKLPDNGVLPPRTPLASPAKVGHGGAFVDARERHVRFVHSPSHRRPSAASQGISFVADGKSRAGNRASAAGAMGRTNPSKSGRAPRLFNRGSSRPPSAFRQRAPFRCRAAVCMVRGAGVEPATKEL